MTGKPNEMKQETERGLSQGTEARPAASHPVSGEGESMPGGSVSHQDRADNGYDPTSVEAVAAQSRRLQRLLEDMAQARTVLGHKEWLGDRPAVLAQELERQATLAVALQEAAARQADGEAMRGLSHLRTVATLSDELDAGWLWLLEPEQRRLKDNYAALHQGLKTDLQKQVGEILTSPATAVERLRAKILEVARDTFTRQAAYDAVVAEVGTRADEAVERGRWREAQELLNIVRETAAPWAGPTARQRQRGRLGNLVRSSSPEEPSRQQLSGTDQQPASHPARPIGRPPRRTEKGERPSSPVVSDALMPSAEDRPEQGKEP